MERINRDLFINILQSIEYDLEVASAISADRDISDRRQQQVEMKDAFYKKYYQYINDFQHLQEQFAKEHYV